MKNKYCHYTSSRIMTTNISLIHESVFLIIREDVYNNICFCYTRRCIMTIFISLIHENVFLIIREDV